MSKKVGIIGLGWLGVHLAEHLKICNYSVWGTVRNLPPENDQIKACPTFKWTFPENFSNELSREFSQSEAVIITVPPTDFSPKEYGELMAQILDNISAKTKVIYTSSIGIYPKKKGVFHEDSEDLVQGAIHAAEQEIFKHGQEAVVLRLGGLIGKDRNPVHYLINKENTDPEGLVHLIHQKDVACIIEIILRTQNVKGVFNVVNPSEMSRIEYYTNVAQQLGLGLPKFNNLRTELTDRKVISTKLADSIYYESYQPYY